MKKLVFALLVTCIGCSGSSEHCPEGSKGFGEGPPLGVEVICKVKKEGEWVAEGPKIKWFLNEKVKLKTTFRAGKEEGTRTEWNEKEVKLRETPYLAGEKHGKALVLYENGKTKTETPYVKGKKQGLAYEFYETGAKLSETRYDAGQSKEVRRWYEDGIQKGSVEWIEMPGGDFTQGAKAERGNPPKRVKLAPFQISRTEVTVAQYRRCMDSRQCTEPKRGPTCNWRAPGRTRHPINCVSAKQAEAFAKWTGGRLPTAAEWEFAARSAGGKAKYPWGKGEPSCDRVVMNLGGDGCGKGSTWPVCSKRKGDTKQGVCDMSGNVWEWVSDTKGKGQEFKGGSFNSIALHFRVTNRRSVPPTTKTSILGFRVAK